MKRVLIIVIAVISLMITFKACGNNTKNLSTFEKIDKNKVITMGLNDTYPPMEFRNKNHDLIGFDVDLGKEIGKKLGVKTEIVTNDWKGIILSLKAKKYDMILSGMSITDERKKEVSFSKPYIVGGQRIVVNRNSNNIKDLNNKIVGCQIGTTGHIAAEKMKGLKQVKKYDSITSAFTDLSIGRIDAVIADAQVARYYLNREKNNLLIIDKKVTEEPLGIAFRKEDDDLKDKVQNIMDELKTDGTLSKLSEKWFGENIYK